MLKVAKKTLHLLLMFSHAQQAYDDYWELLLLHTVMQRQQLLRHLSWGMQLQRCMQKRGWGKRSALVAHNNRDADAAAVAANPKGCSNACKICSHITLPVVDDVAQAKEP